jgi:hypothetical protein
MVVITDFGRNYNEDPLRNWNLWKWDSMCSDFYLYYGLGSASSQWPEKLYPQHPDRNIYIHTEEPSCDPNMPCDHESRFNKILTFCPYTTAWVNDFFYPNKRIAVFQPTDKDLLPVNTNKIYDVIYTGYSSNKEIKQFLSIISKFKHCHVSFGKNEYSTHVSVTYSDKLKLIASSKITIVHNILNIVDSQIAAVKKVPKYKMNEAFSHIEQNICPQLKTRTFEASLCKSLLLVRKDPWNLIEKYFKENEDFVYFEPNNLEDTISNILNNYKDYEKIINNAYDKSLNNYTSEKFVQTYLKGLFL